MLIFKIVDSDTYQVDLQSVLFHVWNGVSNAASDDVTVEVLYGNSTIVEEILGLKFSLSHNAFFQVNTLAAEKLYEMAGEWAGLTKESTLLDVCCGTGTIGLCFAKQAAY